MLFGEVQVQYADGRVETLPLTKATVRIGRSAEGNDIVLDDSQVSRNHAELQCGRHSIHIMDLSSANGVWVSGERIPRMQPRPLENGASFSIGRVQLVLLSALLDGVYTRDVRVVSGLAGTGLVPPDVPGNGVSVAATPPLLERAVPEDAATPAAAAAQPEPAAHFTTAPQIILTVDPADADIAPGTPAVFTAKIINRTSRVDAAVLAVEGVPREWVTVTPVALIDEQGQREQRYTPTSSGDISLMPNQSGELQVAICPPPEPTSLAGDYPCVFRARLAEQSDVTSTLETLITVLPFMNLKTNLSPEQSTARLRKNYIVEASNLGNAPVLLDLRAHDRQNLLNFSFQPAHPELAPGMQMPVTVLAQPRKGQWFGQPASYDFTVALAPRGAVQQENTHHGQLTLRWLPLWPFVLLLLLLLTLLLLQPIVDLLRPVPPNTILQQGPLTETLQLNGQIVPAAVLPIAFEREGVVEAIQPAGALVKKGDELAHLRYYEQLRAIRAAEDALKDAQAALDQARKQNEVAQAAAKIELDKAKAEAARLAPGGADDPARKAQRALDEAQRAAEAGGADQALAVKKAEAQWADARRALDEAQQKYSRANWEWIYVQKYGTDPNFVPQKQNTTDANGVSGDSTQTEAPKLNEVQRQAFIDKLNTAARAITTTQDLLNVAEQTLARANTAQFVTYRASNDSVQSAQEQLDALKGGDGNAEQIAAKSALDAAQLKLETLQSPDLNAQLKAVSDATRALDDARAKLAQGRILAPADGRVLSTAIITGGMAQAQVPIIQLASPDRVEVGADLSAAQMQQLALGQKVDIVAKTSNSTPTSATVSQLAAAPAATGTTPTAAAGAPAGARARFTLADAGRFAGAAGSVVDISANITLVANTTSIPVGYLVSSGEVPKIWVRSVTDLRIAKIPHDRLVPVHVGKRTATQVEILPEEGQTFCTARPDISTNRNLDNTCWLIIAPPNG